jgi:hypothetical protein
MELKVFRFAETTNLYRTENLHSAKESEHSTIDSDMYPLIK